MKIKISETFAKLAQLSLAAAILVMGTMGSGSWSTLAQDTPPAPPGTFKIIVKATLSGNIVEGVDFKLAGNNITKEKTSGLTETEFTELSAGSYTVTVIFTPESDFEIATNSQGAQTVVLSETNQSENIVFFLKEKAPPVDENYEKIKAIKLPQELTKIGSTSTDLSKLNKDKLNAVENFIFDNPGFNKITYIEKLDLSNFDNYSKINLIADYIDLETLGKASFDTDLLPVFNKKARITMSKIRLKDLGDGQIAKIARNGVSAADITNISYKNNTLTFEVPGFSVYTLLPRLVLDFNSLQKSTTEADLFSTTKNEFELIGRTDNLDAKIAVFNNGTLVNVPETVDADGRISGKITLQEGNNRLKVTAELANGEKAEQFFTIKYNTTTETPNNASTIFGITFFLLIIIAGLGLGFYYLKTRRASVMGDTAKSSSQNKQPLSRSIIGANTKTSSTPTTKYENSLLTDEEKSLYNGENSISEKSTISEIGKDKIKPNKPV